VDAVAIPFSLSAVLRGVGESCNKFTVPRFSRRIGTYLTCDGWHEGRIDSSVEWEAEYEAVGRRPPSSVLSFHYEFGILILARPTFWKLELHPRFRFPTVVPGWFKPWTSLSFEVLLLDEESVQPICDVLGPVFNIGSFSPENWTMLMKPERSTYVFNQSGQTIDVAGLLCLFDSDGPCGNAVKDSQRTNALSAHLVSIIS
jgi:hypothetical protein